MDKKYIDLFKNLAQSTALSAEQVMEYDEKKGDKDALETAKIMRDNYEDLHTRIEAAQDEYILTKADAAKLIIGAYIVVNQLQDRIDTLRKAIAGYQTDLIPKLQDIVDNAENDEAAAKMANEKFIIENNE